MSDPLLIPTFSLEVEPDRERVIVHLSGELDLACAPTLKATLEDLIASGFQKLVVDLRELGFVDSRTPSSARVGRLCEAERM